MAVLPNSFRCFGHSIVLTVPIAVGFKPKFLLGCCLTPPVKEAFTTNTATRRHRIIFTYLMDITTPTLLITIHGLTKEVNRKSIKNIMGKKNLKECKVEAQRFS